jgi:hypothetical protein
MHFAFCLYFVYTLTRLVQKLNLHYKLVPLLGFVGFKNVLS